MLQLHQEKYITAVLLERPDTQHQPPIDPADYEVGPRWSVTQALLGRVQQPMLGACEEGHVEGERQVSSIHP